MASTPITPRVDTGMLLLADISGYTSFLAAVAAAHPEMADPGGSVPTAYPVIASLLDAVVERITPAYRLAQVEGDAVFAYAAMPAGPDGESVETLSLVRLAYAAFRERIDQARLLQADDCQACLVLGTLELKFVLHHGTFVVHSVAGMAQLAGPAVNVAHRLLKNSITAKTGLRAYLLVTDAAADHLRLRAGHGLAHEEHYDDIGPISGRVIELAEPARDTA